MRILKRGAAIEVDETGESIVADVTETDSAATFLGESGRDVRRRRLAFRVLPIVALVLVGIVGGMRWLDQSYGSAAADDSVGAAKDGTVAILSYKPSSVEQDMDRASGLLTGAFKADYTNLAKEKVIPGSKKRQVSAVATVPTAASVSADARHAVVLVFVNQTVIIGNGAPTSTSSSIRVALDKVGDRWLISAFDPV